MEDRFDVLMVAPIAKEFPKSDGVESNHMSLPAKM